MWSERHGHICRGATSTTAPSLSEGEIRGWPGRARHDADTLLYAIMPGLGPGIHDFTPPTMRKGLADIEKRRLRRAIDVFEGGVGDLGAVDLDGVGEALGREAAKRGDLLAEFAGKGRGQKQRLVERTIHVGDAAREANVAPD